MPQAAGHKWFATFWDWQTRHEPAKIRAWRDENSSRPTQTLDA